MYQFVWFIRKNLEYTYGLDKINIQIFGVGISEEETSEVMDRREYYTLDNLSNTSILQTLVRFNEESEIRFDFQVVASTYWIIINKPVETVSKVFEYGGLTPNGGLMSITRTTDEGIKPNRIYGVGGTENLPVNYYTLKEGDPTNSEVVQVLPQDPEFGKLYLKMNPQHNDAYDIWSHDGNSWQVVQYLNERRLPFPKYISHYGNLMPKSFRDYLEGWELGYTPDSPPPREDDPEPAKKGYEDGLSTLNGIERYKPITYYQDDEKVVTYGIKEERQDFTDIIPTIKGLYASKDGSELGRLDEIVDVYVPPNGEFWNDAVNVVTNLDTGTRYNRRVPYIYMPPQHSTREERATFGGKHIRYNDNGYTDLDVVFTKTVDVNLNNPLSVSVDTTPIRIVPDLTDQPYFSKIRATIKTSAKIMKREGYQWVEVAGSMRYNGINTKIITVTHRPYYQEDGVNVYYQEEVGETILRTGLPVIVNKNLTEVFVKVAEGYERRYFSTNTPQIGDKVDDKVYYIESRLENNEVTVSADITRPVDVPLQGEYRVKFEMHITFSGATHPYYGIMDHYVVEINIRSFRITVTPRYGFNDSRKTFFIWTKELFFNPIHERWKDEEVYIAFQSGKLAGNKFAITSVHSESGFRGVFDDDSRTYRTTNEDGDEILVPSRYCIELAMIENRTEDVNMFIDMPSFPALVPAKGDLFIIEGVKYPFDPYVLNAEQRLENALIEHLNKDSRYSYAITIDHIAINRLGINYNQLKAGNKIKIRNNSLAGTSGYDYASLTIKSVQITRANDQLLDRYVLNVSNIEHKRSVVARPPVIDRDIEERDLEERLRRIESGIDESTSGWISRIGGFPQDTDISSVFGEIREGTPIFGDDSLESELRGETFELSEETKLRLKRINTKNKEIMLLADARHNSLLGYFVKDKDTMTPMQPNIVIRDNMVVLEEDVLFALFDSEDVTSLPASSVPLKEEEVNYIYVHKERGSMVLSVSYELLDDKENYLIGFVNPVKGGFDDFEEFYMGDKVKPAEVAKRFPPIRITDRMSFVEKQHNLGYNPNVKVVLDNGDVVEVSIFHPSLDSIELSWVGEFNGYAYLD